MLWMMGQSTERSHEIVHMFMELRVVLQQDRIRFDEDSWNVFGQSMPIASPSCISLLHNTAFYVLIYASPMQSRVDVV
jgi:hypothetical protein